MRPGGGGAGGGEERDRKVVSVAGPAFIRRPQRSLLTFFPRRQAEPLHNVVAELFLRFSPKIPPRRHRGPSQIVAAAKQDKSLLIALRSLVCFYGCCSANTGEISIPICNIDNTIFEHIISAPLRV